MAVTSGLFKRNIQQSAIEPLLLEQFQEMPFPYVTKFYDYRGFCEETRTTIPADNNGDNGNDVTKVSLPDGSTEGLSFDELMENAHECWRHDDLVRIYTKAAYEKYKAGEKGKPFYVGLMWYYLAYLNENAEYYEKSGAVYKADGDFANAAMAYQEAYKTESKESYAEEALEMYYNVVFNDEASSDTIDDLSWFVCYLQNNYQGKTIPYLDKISRRLPNEVPIQTVRAMRHIKVGKVDDPSLINRLLNTRGLHNNPKLLITKAYLQFANGSSFDADKIYSLYEKGVSFYPEDVVNLGWLMYIKGEYGKAYKLASEALAGKELISDTYPLLAEIYLQDESSSIDGKALTKKLVDVDTSWYDASSQLRLQIMTLMLSAKTGANIDMSDVAAMSLKLFNGEEFEDFLIRATVAYEAKEYSESYNICQQMLEMKLGNKEKHRVLFLYTDTLIELANRDSEKRDEYLKQAEEAMNIVRNDVEDDYVECLKRLHKIYDLQEDTEKRDKIRDFLLQYE